MPSSVMEAHSGAFLSILVITCKCTACEPVCKFTESAGFKLGPDSRLPPGKLGKVTVRRTLGDIIIFISLFDGPNTKAIQIWCSFCCKVDINLRFLGPIIFFQMAHQNFKWPFKILIFACKYKIGREPLSHFHDPFIFWSRNIHGNHNEHFKLTRMGGNLPLVIRHFEQVT